MWIFLAFLLTQPINNGKQDPNFVSTKKRPSAFKLLSNQVFFVGHNLFPLFRVESPGFYTGAAIQRVVLACDGATGTVGVGVAVACGVERTAGAVVAGVVVVEASDRSGVHSPRSASVSTEAVGVAD